jgi:Uma2 family endonuclease
MTARTDQKMTVDEYLAWAEGRHGRFELYAGTVYAMTPERAGHAKIKFGVQSQSPGLASSVTCSRME